MAFEPRCGIARNTWSIVAGSARRDSGSATSLGSSSAALRFCRLCTAAHPQPTCRPDLLGGTPIPHRSRTGSRRGLPPRNHVSGHACVFPPGHRANVAWNLAWRSECASRIVASGRHVRWLPSILEYRLAVVRRTCRAQGSLGSRNRLLGTATKCAALRARCRSRCRAAGAPRSPRAASSPISSRMTVLRPVGARNSAVVLFDTAAGVPVQRLTGGFLTDRVRRPPGAASSR